MSHLSQIVLFAASVAGFLVGLGAVTTVSQIRSYAFSVQVRPSLVRSAPHVPIAATTPLTHRAQLAASPVVETAPAAPQARVPFLPLLAAVMGALTLPVLALLGLRRSPAPSAVSLLAVSGEEQAAPEEERTYYFLVANAKFMLFEEEQAMELLREKRRFLKEKEMPQDFWLVPQPEFLSSIARHRQAGAQAVLRSGFHGRVVDPVHEAAVRPGADGLLQGPRGRQEGPRDEGRRSACRRPQV
eukprot:TRINITY_DN1268_c0_g1_i1.p1 TRINITY_DN1268_c0_g1~~TRINITY_DN1268_c0_g1_i1.p1  ORF type:complete len:250 (+),score=49.37 TRINITY_DN1268_c0_g1_i1:22-750(+)